MNDFICFAHRGASGHEPENTLRSINKAIALGAAWIEIDVHRVENELVVIHDNRLERTTNGTGYVSERSLSYLRSLDAGLGERIPLLREVFESVGNRAGINIELKGPGTSVPVINLIDEYVNTGRLSYKEILLSSFYHDKLKRIKSVQPEIRTGVILGRTVPSSAQFAEELGSYSVHLRLGHIKPKLIDDAHQRGLKVFVYTVNHPEELSEIQILGVDGVFTDYPELLSP